MSLLLAPYTHAMRLGQGFNSYTQQICIDDAVVVDEQRPENVVTNDGTTMRIMAQKSATPSAWTRQREVIVGAQATAVLEENARKAKDEVALINKVLEQPADETIRKDSQAAPDVTSDDKPLPPADPKTSGSDEPDSAGAPKDSGDEPSAEESGSINTVADADEARKVDVEAADQDKARKNQEPPSKQADLKPTADSKESKTLAKPPTTTATPSSKKTPKSVRGRHSSVTASSSTSTTSAVIKPAETETVEKSGQVKADGDSVDRDAVMANIQVNDSQNEAVKREAIAANLQANDGNTAPQRSVKRGVSSDRASAAANGASDRAAISAALTGTSDRPTPSKPTKRGVSSDRARQLKSDAPPDRAAIKAALTGGAKPDPAKAAREEAEMARREQEEAEVLAEQRRYRKQLEQEQRKEENERRAEERQEQRQIRAEKRAWEVKRREEARKAIDAAANVKSATLEELEKIRAQNQFVERFNGMSEQKEKYDFDPTAPRGPSQTVTYNSRFVDRLSDVTEDMSVSGSLSIKAGRVGGSGKGSFVDSDKFKESDLNFYISVKVVNQTINFKDALVYNPLRSVDKANFREVYGDSFISGFVEGGEFNALVSMKILNKAKLTDIKAEAKIALTAGSVDIKAEANVGIARSNIETNTETTIQVSWSGGGHIKPMEQQWDIQSLMAAAARFPDLVADCPQRTYAILTKYDALRSFVAQKPASYTPLQYENAQIYTNTLLDSFISYKAMYKRLGEQIAGVQRQTLDIVAWGEAEKDNIMTVANATPRTGGPKDTSTGMYPFKEIQMKFPASITGISDARTAIRRQMARIVNEVDAIEKDPKLATDEDHTEPYQAPVAFEARIPVVEVPERLRLKSHPLSGKLIAAKVLTGKEQQEQQEQEEKFAATTSIHEGTSKLTPDETTAFDDLLRDRPGLGADFRASDAVGSEKEGKPFNNLDFMKKDWEIRSIRVQMEGGELRYLAVSYENGLLVEKGKKIDETKVLRFGDFSKGERITSAAIEYGKAIIEGKPMRPLQILGLRLFTNRGRSFIAKSLQSKNISRPDGQTAVERDGFRFENVSTVFVDMPFNSGTLKGFFGRSDDQDGGRIFRLGLLWCKLPELSAEEKEVAFDGAPELAVADGGDRAEFEQAQRQEMEKLKKKLQDKEEDLKRTQEVVTTLEKAHPRNEPQSGIFYATQKGWQWGYNSSATCSINFERTYPKPPRLLFGLNKVDLSSESGKNRALQITNPKIRANGFSVETASFATSVGHEIGCSWMTLPNDLHLETGMINTYGSDRETDKYVAHVHFSEAFERTPTVEVWFQAVEVWGPGQFSIKLETRDVTPYSFHVEVQSWLGRKFKNARLQYLAFDKDEKRVKSGAQRVTRVPGKLSEPPTPFPGEPFKKMPATFIGIRELDFEGDKNLRFECWANAPNNKNFEWSAGTWADSKMDHADFVWIAIE